MNGFVTGCETAFTWTLSTGLAVAPLVLGVALVDWCAGRRLGAGWRCLLWTVVALRMLLPAAPASPWGLPNAWEAIAGTQAASVPIRQQGVAFRTSGLSLETFVAQTQGPRRNGAPPAPPRAGREPAQGWFTPGSLLRVGALAWLIGLAAVSARACLASARFAARIGRSRQVTDAKTVSALREACGVMSVARAPGLRLVEGLPSPALWGLIRPVICLPADESMKHSQLRMIFLHELAHAKRGDAWRSWLLQVVRSLHWYNPIAWGVARRVEANAEIACDEAVRQAISTDERSDYVDLLLHYSSDARPSGLGIAGLWFARPAQDLRRRVALFGAERSRGSKPLAAAVLLPIVLFGFTQASTGGGSPTPPLKGAAAVPGIDPGQLGFGISAEDGLDDSTPVERLYDVASALGQLADADKQTDAKQHLALYLLLSGATRDALLGVREDGRWNVRMTERQHANFAQLLEGLSRSGPWQVVVSPRILELPDLERIEGVDWDRAVRFSYPAWHERKPHPRSSQVEHEENEPVVAHATSAHYAPYLAVRIDRSAVESLLSMASAAPTAKVLQAPRITFFNGQEGRISDTSQSAFVLGVQPIVGELATAYQPEIAVIEQGNRISLRPLVSPEGAVDLSCRVTTSQIDRVDQFSIPGKGITVEAPKVSTTVIEARCELREGEALLVAPLLTNKEPGGSDTHRCYLFSAEPLPLEDSAPSAQDANKG